MTKAAKHFGKQLQHFWGAVDTRAYMTALLEAQGKTSKFDELFTTKAGYNGGTWAHPKLAVFFARWLDVAAAKSPAK